MPDGNPMPTHVLTTEAVRWSIDALGAQRLHPTFVMYLYLRNEERAGRLADASAGSESVQSLIVMPGNPSKPYYFPLIDRGVRTGKPLASFWRARNISGSWSPGSIFRLKSGGWLGVNGGGYVLPPDHVERAYSDLLYSSRVSALALGSFFLRNDGFVLSGEAAATDVIAAFRVKFDYPAESEAEFARLYTQDVPDDAGFDWFEPVSDPGREASPPDKGQLHV